MRVLRLKTAVFCADDRRWIGTPLSAALLACLVSGAGADELQLLRANPDPYGYPRPAPGETDVPTGTSFFFQLGLQDRNTDDTVAADTVAVRIRPQGGPAVELLAREDASPTGILARSFRPKTSARACRLYRRRGRPGTVHDVPRDGARQVSQGSGLERGQGLVAIHHRSGTGHARVTISARPGDAAGPLARRFFHGVLQAQFLHQRVEPPAEVRIERPREKAVPQSLESATRLLADGHGAPARISQRGTAQRRPRAGDAPHHRLGETRRRGFGSRGRFLRTRPVRNRIRPSAGGRLSSGRRSADRRRRQPRASQGGRGGRRFRDGEESARDAV